MLNRSKIPIEYYNERIINRQIKTIAHCKNPHKFLPNVHRYHNPSTRCVLFYKPLCIRFTFKKEYVLSRIAISPVYNDTLLRLVDSKGTKHLCFNRFKGCHIKILEVEVTQKNFSEPLCLMFYGTNDPEVQGHQLVRDYSLLMCDYSSNSLIKTLESSETSLCVVDSPIGNICLKVLFQETYFITRILIEPFENDVEIYEIDEIKRMHQCDYVSCTGVTKEFLLILTGHAEVCSLRFYGSPIGSSRAGKGPTATFLTIFVLFLFK